MSAGKRKPRRKSKHKTHGPPLSLRQIRFCQFYFDTDNATRSYINAGLHHKNENSAGVLAFLLLRNVKIREYIQKLRDDAYEAAQVTIDELAADLRNIKEADLTLLMGKNGEYLHPHKWPKKLAKTIESIELGEVGNVRKRLIVKKVKLSSKMAAIAKLAEWKRMTGQDKSETGKEAEKPLVIGGEADPGAL